MVNRLRVRRSKKYVDKWEVVGGGYKPFITQSKSKANQVKTARVRVKLKRKLRRKGIKFNNKAPTSKLRSLARRK